VMSHAQLEGKTAIITGAGRGIGAALAHGFAAAGAAVVCTARTTSEIESVVQTIMANGQRALAVPADVTDLNAVEAMTRRTIDAFGSLDVLVVNAGINLDRRTITQSVPDDWLATLQTNLTGAYYCLKAALPHMKRGGQIIMIGSGLGHRAMPGRSAYAVSKAGLWMLVRSAAEDLWEAGICVNELIPGPVDTDLFTTSRTAAVPSAIDITREWNKPPEAVLPLALWLASNDHTGPTGQSFSLMRRDSQ